jgi:hypothetical protein
MWLMSYFTPPKGPTNIIEGVLAYTCSLYQAPRKRYLASVHVCKPFWTWIDFVNPKGCETILKKHMWILHIWLNLFTTKWSRLILFWFIAETIWNSLVATHARTWLSSYCLFVWSCEGVGIRGFFFFQFCEVRGLVNYHPQEGLATFGYKSKRKVDSFLWNPAIYTDKYARTYGWNMGISTFFSPQTIFSPKNPFHK